MQIERRKDHYRQRLEGVQHPDVFKKLLEIFLEYDMRSQEHPEMRLNWKSQGPYHRCQQRLSSHPADQNILNFPTKVTPRAEESRGIRANDKISLLTFYLKH